MISIFEYCVIFNMQKATDTVPQCSVDGSSVFKKAESFYSEGGKILCVPGNQSYKMPNEQLWNIL